MDPNANLEEQRKIAYDLLTEDMDADQTYHLSMRLAELVNALDQWICNGGFLPAAWSKK